MATVDYPVKDGAGDIIIFSAVTQGLYNPYAPVNREFLSRYVIQQSDNRAACGGNSISRYGSTDLASHKAGTGLNYSRSSVHVGNARAGSPFVIVDNIGVSGATSTEILNGQLQRMLEINPCVAIWQELISNDEYASPAIPVSKTVENIKAIVLACHSQGVFSLLGDTLPRSSEGGAPVTRRGQVWRIIRHWIRKNNLLAGIFRQAASVLDVSSRTAINNNTPLAQFYINESGALIHLDAEGARQASGTPSQRYSLSWWFNELGKLKGLHNGIIGGNGFDAGDTSNLIDNPFGAGTSGGKGSGLTGSTPDTTYGQTISGSIAGVASVITRSVALTELGGHFLFNRNSNDRVTKISCSSAAIATDTMVLALYTNSNAPIPPADGQYISGVTVGIRVNSGSVSRIDAAIKHTGTLTADCGMNMTANAGDSPTITGTDAFTLQTQPFNTRAGGAVSQRVMEIIFGTAAGASVDFYFSDPFLIKLEENII
jgi:hypothetical protein